MPAKSIVDRKVVIIGAGPAGLTAAYELSKHSVPAVVLERDNTVGGLARTVNHKGYLFDVGGHRFFTKWDEVNQIWREVLGEQFLERSRLSRIFYRRKFFYYPLRVKNALFGLGVVDSARVVFSYLKSRLFHYENEQIWSNGSRTDSESGCTRSSSRPIPKRCGACPARKFVRSGPPSAFRVFR